MAAFKLKLEIDQGATFRESLIWKTGEPPLPVDLTGFTARMQVRSETGSEIVLAELTTENGGITLNVEPGLIELYISDLETAGYTWETGTYDIEFVAPDPGDGTRPDVVRRIAGAVVVSREVTR